MSPGQSFVAACLFVGLGACAWAQSSVPPDVDELRRAHQADEDERGAIPEKPRPNFVEPQRLHPARQPWRCLGTNPWHKVYAAPDASSPVIGLTQPQIAVTGDPVNGFLPVLYYNGRLGYLPAASVHAFHQPDHPETTCTFAGLTAQGRPMFRFDRSGADQ
jgi:hypothetical protein